MVKNLTELASKAHPKTLFVLDIDSSLVLTHKRNEAILRHFAQSLRHKNPELSEALATAECRPLEYGYFAGLERALPTISKEDAEHIHSFWKQHFFSNDFLHFDIPHAGALEFVRILSERAQPFVYLTGRPSNLMRPGTLDTMAKLGFHITDKMLHMKPDDSHVDEGYKAAILKDIIRGYDEVVFIDNEPRVLHLIEKFYPQAHLIFVDTCHSPNVTAPESAFKMKDFNELNALLTKGH